MKELSDLTAPAAVERKPPLEAEVQKQCVDWMRGRGYWCRKFSSLSQRSVPDYLFSFASERALIKFFTEFKREDCKVDKKTGFMSTEAQVEEQEAMRKAGWYGFECNDFETFKATVIAYERRVLC
jgi:hypothetical protein